jgi:phage major head subunit gpT-like protein
MIINKFNLSALYTAFLAAFNSGLGAAPSQYQRIATVVPSTTGTNEYGWLGRFPKMREWIGDRVINGMLTHGYSIKNRSFELTVGVDRDDIEDDNIGIYTPMMTEMGQSAGENPDELVFGLIKSGHSTLCYDGQYFFDTDHPVIGDDGVTSASQSNLDNNGDAGTRWYLLDCSRALKPIIFQDRKKPNFVAKTADTDDNVFHAKEFVYGVDSRCAVGFGFWQQAYCSRKTLDETNLIAAYTAMTERKGDHGRALGIKPTILLVPPSLEFAARKLVNVTTLANGAENVLKGLVEVVSDPRLA